MSNIETSSLAPVFVPASALTSQEISQQTSEKQKIRINLTRLLLRKTDRDRMEFYNIDLVDPILPRVPDSERVRTYLPRGYCISLYNSLGPNWEYHAGQELFERCPEAFPEDMSPVLKAQIIGQMLVSKETRPSFSNGDGIVNEGTLKALHSWSPGVKINYWLAKNPDLRLRALERGGVMVVARMEDPTLRSSGTDIPFESPEKRRTKWRAAINEVHNGRLVYCNDCLNSDRSPPEEPPILRRQNCLPRFSCHEDVPLRCEDCSKIHVRHIAY